MQEPAFDASRLPLRRRSLYLVSISTTRGHMPYFRIATPGATSTIVEASDWETAVARYVRLREYTGWSGSAPLTVVEVVTMRVARDTPELIFSDDLFRIAMRMLRAKPGKPDEFGWPLESLSGSAPRAKNDGTSLEDLIQALIEFSALKLRDAREPSSGLPTRVAAAFDSAYAALLAIARRHSLPDHEQHPSAKALRAAAVAGGLGEQDVMLGLRLLRWVVAEQYVEPETLPVSVPTAIEWAERVRALLSN